MSKALKTRASKQQYISPVQSTLPGFETPKNSVFYGQYEASLVSYKISSARF